MDERLGFVRLLIYFYLFFIYFLFIFYFIFLLCFYDEAKITRICLHSFKRQDDKELFLYIYVDLDCTFDIKILNPMKCNRNNAVLLYFDKFFIFFSLINFLYLSAGVALPPEIC